MTLLVLVLLVALVFEYVNGFHDTANAVATVVSTKVLTPRLAVAWASAWNLVGALSGTAVATTIGKGLVDTGAVTMPILLCTLVSAVVWGLLTWWLGLPSSSSHALVGGLCGATLAGSGGNWAVLRWSTGLWPKVVLPMVLSPIAGFAGGMLLMSLLMILLSPGSAADRLPLLRKGAARQRGLHGVQPRIERCPEDHGHRHPDPLHSDAARAPRPSSGRDPFPRIPEFTVVPKWIVVVCALTMAAGTAGGGKRIIRTMGQKLVKLQPVQGFAAETAAACVIYGSSPSGCPFRPRTSSRPPSWAWAPPTA